MTELTIPPFVTWQQFGCFSESYFKRYIKGIELQVVGEFDNTVTVQDETGEQWVLNKSTLISEKHKAEQDNYPWRTEIDSYQISKDNARIREEMRKALLTKTIAKDRLRIELIQLCKVAFDRGDMTESEFDFWIAYTRLSLEEDLKASIKTLQDILNRPSINQAA